MERKEIVTIAIITFIAVVLWVASSLIHTGSSVPENPKLRVLLLPLDPNLPQTVIDKISQIQPLPTAARKTPDTTPIPIETPTASPSSQVNFLLNQSTSAGVLQ